jgi:hypothetical protein
MRKRRIADLWLCTGGVVLAGFAIPLAASGQVTGNLATTSVQYGSPLATQTIATSYGDNTANDGTSSGGSELDAAYGVVANGDLDLFFAGNLEAGSVADHLDVFIDDGRAGGQNPLNANGSDGSLHNLNNSVFSSNFYATFALDCNDYENTFYIDDYDLLNGSGNYLGGVSLNKGIGSATYGGIAFGVNNTNVSTMTGTAAGAASNTAASDAVQTGFEMSIPLATLGNPAPGSNILVMADISGPNDTSGSGQTALSNQFLPGLPVGTATEASPFNFSSTPGQYFSVGVPVVLPNGDWLTLSGSNWNNSANWSNGAVPNAAGAVASFANASVANAVVTVDGSFTVGSLVFSGSNSYTLSANANGTLNLNSGSTSNNAQIVLLSGSHTIAAPLVLTSNTSISLAEHGEVLTISGNVSGSGSISVMNQAGLGANYSAVVLSGSNTYTGGTNIITGNVQLASAGALPAGSVLSLYATDLPAGVLDLNGNSINLSSLTEVTGPNTGALGAVAQIINTNATSGTATITYAGTSANPSTYVGNINDSSISGGNATALSILSGSLTLTGTNTYGGGTTIASGADLTIASASGAGTAIPSDGNVVNNGTFNVGTATVADDVLLGSITGTGTTVVGDSTYLTVVNYNSGALVDNFITEFIGSAVAGPISDNGSGTLLVDSSLQLASNSGDSEISTLNLSSGGTLDLNGNNFAISNFINSAGATILNNNAFSGSTLTFAGTSSNNFQGNIVNGAPPPLTGVQPAPVIASNYRVALLVTGGQWTLSNGSNTYTGGTTIETGAELTAASSSSLPPSEPIANSGLLTINNGVTSTVGQITDPSGTGTLNISGTLQLAPNSGQSVQSALDVNSGAALDLTNNSFVVKYGSGSDPLSTIQSYLADGYDAGWAGGEIQSSSVAALNASQSALIYSVGYADGADGITGVPSGEIEILPTLAGDAKMQGNVVFGDFQLLSQYFGQANTTWDEGDFTYNGTTNFGDFQLLSQNFGQSAGGLTSGEIASINSFAAQFGEAYVPSGSGYSLVSVPEPASAALIGLCSLGLLGRRKRKS